MITNATISDLLTPDFQSYPRWFLISFVTISITESVIGIVGNIFVIFIMLFFQKSTRRKIATHNCFIVNLALSDFVLCLFTMPLNTYRSSNVYTTFSSAFCKLADSFPAINICVSSLTIVAISIYRYLLVCYPHTKFFNTFSTYFIMISVWLLAIGAASPLFLYSSSVNMYDSQLINTMATLLCNNSTNSFCENEYFYRLSRLRICLELWPEYGYLRLLYTMFMLFLQTILPIFIICITYYRIMVKLQERFRHRFLMKRHNVALLRNEIRRQRRNNILLLLIVSIYAISWLPFNISYILFTYVDRFRKMDHVNSLSGENNNHLSIYFPLRFLVCMISSITNPFLYSYFNETFKDGLKRICSTRYPALNQQLGDPSNDQTINLSGQHRKRYKKRTSAKSTNQTFQYNLSPANGNLSKKLTILDSNPITSSHSSYA